MFAAVISKSPPWWQNFVFNWFDVAVVLVLAFGLWRGRRRGMSREFLPTSMWLLIVLGGAYGHVWLSGPLLRSGVIKSVVGAHCNNQTAALVAAYLVIALAVIVFFSLLNRLGKHKLEGSNAFGSGEYYLGMIAGTVRYGCILLTALALLNAPFYSLADILAKQAFNKQVFGGGLYEGDYLPDLQTVQANVFKQSLFGPFIKEHLDLLLINSNPSGGQPAAKHPVIHIGN